MLNFITTTEETDPFIENDFVVPTCFSTCVGCGIRSGACMNSIWRVQLRCHATRKESISDRIQRDLFFLFCFLLRSNLTFIFISILLFLFYLKQEMSHSERDKNVSSYFCDIKSGLVSWAASILIR